MDNNGITSPQPRRDGLGNEKSLLRVIKINMALGDQRISLPSRIYHIVRVFFFSAVVFVSDSGFAACLFRTAASPWAYFALM